MLAGGCAVELTPRTDTDTPRKAHAGSQASEGEHVRHRRSIESLSDDTLSSGPLSPQPALAGGRWVSWVSSCRAQASENEHIRHLRAVSEAPPQVERACGCCRGGAQSVHYRVIVYWKAMCVGWGEGVLSPCIQTVCDCGLMVYENN